MDKVEREQSEEEIKEFFQQWNVYQKIIAMNYMMHREMFDLLLESIKYKTGAPISILDVGCGDAAIIARALNEKQVVEYCGIDLSAVALNCAAENLKDVNCKKQFIEADFSDAIKQIEKPFDIVIAGFSLHHLVENEKDNFFKAVRNILAKDGCLVIYDLIRSNNESRETYLKRLCKTYQQEWSVMSEQEMEDIYSHINNNDYPEQVAYYGNMAEKFDFSGYELKFRDEAGLYGFCCFRK